MYCIDDPCRRCKRNYDSFSRRRMFSYNGDGNPRIPSDLPHMYFCGNADRTKRNDVPRNTCHRSLSEPRIDTASVAARCVFQTTYNVHDSIPEKLSEYLSPFPLFIRMLEQNNSYSNVFMITAALVLIVLLLAASIMLYRIYLRNQPEMPLRLNLHRLYLKY